MTAGKSLMAVFAGLAILFATSLPLRAATRNVVILYDERVELPGLALIDAEFIRTIKSGSADSIEVYREAMDLSRFDSEPYRAGLRDFLRAKYADKKVDVAMAVMAPALDFLLTNGNLIFPGTQIVFSGLDRSQLSDRVLPPNVHGVLVKREFAPTLELALRLHPAAEKVVVISGTSEFDTLLLAQAQTELQRYEPRISITYLSEPTLSKILTTVSQLSPQNVILFTTMFRDGASQSFVPHEVVERVSTAASVPVYGFVDQYLGRGIVGGSLYSLSEHGAHAARIVLSLLEGKSVPVLSEVPANKVMFDWRQMQRWNIDERLLPSGAEIDFRDTSIWQTYRWQIMLVLAVVLVEAGLIVGLLYEHRRRQYAEVQSRQRLSELAHMNRYAMAGELTASIAHEHNQPLGAILTNAETAQLMLKSPALDLNGVGEILSDIQRDDRRAGEVIVRLRRLLKKTPYTLTTFGINELVTETVELLSGLAVSRKITLAVSLTDLPLRVKGDRIQLQQVIINLMVNAMDAMAAVQAEDRRIVVSTTRTEKCAEIAVSDVGPGIPAKILKDVFEPFVTTKADGMGLGLSIARTIVQEHEGEIFADNRSTGGAVFRVMLPLASQPDDR